MAQSYLIPLSNNKITTQQLLFIQNYITNGFNATQAAIDANYHSKSRDALKARNNIAKMASELLRRPAISEEISLRLKAQEDAKIASATEILQFYTSVMRGEVLDQFGIEASLDTRIKAANEMAKHKIEIPMKLEQKNITNNIGTIQLNFLPRKKEIDVISEEISQQIE